MSEQANNDQFFLGVLGLKDGKWAPNRKFDGGMFGSALMYAEELDKTPEFDAVKISKINKTTGTEDKEMWVSPRLKARQDAEAAKRVRSGVQETADKLRAQRKAAAKNS